MIRYILCLGSNREISNDQAADFADQRSMFLHGLVTDKNFVPKDPGVYHTSVFDLSVGEIKDLSKHFDQIVVLDQNIEIYQHPESFYLTMALAKDLEQILPVQWQADLSKGIDFFETLVNENPSFCIYPFIEVLVKNGSTTVCCRSLEPVTTIDKITSWKDNAEYNAIRKDMLAGIKIPKHCTACYETERRGIRSARQQETVEWATKLNLTSLADLEKIESPVYFEVRASNLCNLQCRTCIPMDSILIEKEFIKLNLISGEEKYLYGGFDLIDPAKIKKLYVAGGEPTIMPELHSFLQKCVEQSFTDFEFLISTNGVKFSKSFLELTSNFTNLGFIFSIDGFKDANHYIRWPSQWHRIINNVHTVLGQGHQVSFCVTMSIYNISRIYELLEFLDREFYNKKVHMFNAYYEGDIMSPIIHPDRQLVLNELKKCTTLMVYKNDKLLRSFIDGLLTHYQSTEFTEHETLGNFFKFNDLLDQSRNIKLIDYIPELEECRKYIK